MKVASAVALVTGSHGFAGRHLCDELRSRGWTVVGLSRTPRSGPFHSADLADAAAVSRVLAEVRPDVVFHLAGVTTGESIVEANVAAAHGLGTALRGFAGRVVVAGSSAQYGSVASPVTEDSAGEPVSAYGFAKAAAEAVLRGHAISPGGFAVIPVRAFNHIGPGEPATTVAGAFARHIRALLAGDIDRVNVAGLDAVRDFTDVRDIARGYADLAERGVPGRVYNLCSGRPATVGDVLDGLLAAAGLDRTLVDVTPAAPGVRSGQIPYQVGSPERVYRETGWTATIGLEQSTKDLLQGESS